MSRSSSGEQMTRDRASPRAVFPRTHGFGVVTVHCVGRAQVDVIQPAVSLSVCSFARSDGFAVSPEEEIRLARKMIRSGRFQWIDCPGPINCGKGFAGPSGLDENRACDSGPHMSEGSSELTRSAAVAASSHLRGIAMPLTEPPMPRAETGRERSRGRTNDPTPSFRRPDREPHCPPDRRCTSESQ